MKVARRPVYFMLLFVLVLNIGKAFGESAAATYTLDATFPGGNIIVTSTEGDTVKLKQDLKGSPSSCFYWAFRVRNVPKGKTLTFIFPGQKVVSCWGPSVSVDGGLTWKWLHQDRRSPSDRFTYKFESEGAEILFADAPMYVHSDFARFIKPFLAAKTVRREVLCNSEQGRQVDLYRFGNKSNPGKYCVVFTARHHARENAASFVLEGTIAEILSGSKEGNYLLANADFYIIPFMDTDGVENGDPGKNRKPHDHNRDYIKKIYASVQAITTQVPQWSQDGKLLQLDFHCPGLHTDKFFFTNFKKSYILDQMNCLTGHLARRQSGGGIPFTPDAKPSGELNPAMSRAWFSSRPNAILSATLEIPFSTAKGKMVTPANLRELGHNVAKAMADFIRDESAKKDK